MVDTAVPCLYTDPIAMMSPQNSDVTKQDLYVNEVLRPQCQGSIYNSERKLDSLLHYFHAIFSTIRTFVELCFENSTVLASSVILILVMFVLYKSYWKPILYIKELTEIGFEYIPKGPDRALRITRAQNARRLGCKLPPPYPDGWFAVAESQELRTGDVKPVDVLGQNLCVYRGESGQAFCVDAYCPHLGANIGAGGTVTGDCVECPFHKWRFDSTGKCTVQPGETSPRGVSIKSWPAMEVDGAVWIWHDATGLPPKWGVSSAPQLETWGYRGRNEFTVASHIQDIPENGADVAHLNAVHSPSLLTNLGEKYPVLMNLVGQHNWSAEWTRGEDHTAAMVLSHDYKFGKFAVFHIDAVATQIGPGHVRLLIQTVFGPLLISQSVTPLSPLEQRVVHRFFSPWYNAPCAAAFLRGESHMFERDVAIWNNKRFVSSPAYVKSDRSIRGFRSWYGQFYSDASISFRDALARHRNPLDW